MAAVIKKSAVLFVTLFISSLFLSGCGNSSNSEAGSKNLACVFVEGYLDNKSFALKDLAEGGSAKESVNYYLTPLSNEFDSDLDSKQLFSDFFEAMISWGSTVDLAYAQSNTEAITNAAIVLEAEMDEIAIRCETFGWKFEKGWRL
jgi:basic membrane lipoprotein Med (substrate-binding protein (PBP1-ABC) superfamily)